LRSNNDDRRRITRSPPELVIAGFERLDKLSHWLNELVSFKDEAAGLDLAAQIVVLRSTDPDIAASLSADSVLEPLPAMEVNVDNLRGAGRLHYGFASGACERMPDGIVAILFDIDAPTSPLSEGISEDSRMLGLGLCKLSLILGVENQQA
jgi:hypothetical protein